MKKNLLAIDQGTSSSRAILFDRDGVVLGLAQREFPQLFPEAGWVEHDPEAIWESTLHVTREVLRQTDDCPVAIGITNQRETVVVWEKSSGKAIAPAIVWQDRRTASHCHALRAAGKESMVNRKTGLLLDPYFSATKICWLLDHIDGARKRAENGELLAGTIDSFLLWRLTGGAVHATDATNASRTLLFDIERQEWDEELLELFRIPRTILPDVRDSCGDFGVTAKEHFQIEIPICGVAGDQQAAAIGQACLHAGMTKATFGTGCFSLANTGRTRPVSRHKLLSTVAYRIDGKVTFALEGSIFIAGAVVQWLRDQMGAMSSAAQSESLAKSVPNNGGVYFVPAFAGLGAPHWDADARGAIFGLTRETGIAHFARAALESVAYQMHDLTTAMAADGISLSTLRVDGGMATNNWLMQFLANLLEIPVERPANVETTALGAAMLAGLGCGALTDLSQIQSRWQCARRFEPHMASSEREQLLTGWKDAVARTLTR